MAAVFFTEHLPFCIIAAVFFTEHLLFCIMAAVYFTEHLPFCIIVTGGACFSGIFGCWRDGIGVECCVLDNRSGTFGPLFVTRAGRLSLCGRGRDTYPSCTGSFGNWVGLWNEDIANWTIKNLYFQHKKWIKRTILSVWCAVNNLSIGKTCLNPNVRYDHNDSDVCKWQHCATRGLTASMIAEINYNDRILNNIRLV